MDRVAIKQRAKKQIEGKIFTLLAMYIIVSAALGLVSAILSPISIFVSLIVGGPLTYAFAKIFLEITRKGKDPKIEEIIDGFKGDNFGRNFIASLRVEVFTFLWSLLFIIPGIIKGIAYSQMFFLLVDNPKMDAAEAQKRSIEMMDGHKMEWFILQLSFILWYLLGIITFGLAFIYVTPYVEASKAEFYNRLKKAKK